MISTSTCVKNGTATFPEEKMEDESQMLEQWLEEHGDFLFRHALRKVNDPSVAEDLIQITFLSAWESMSKFKTGNSAKNWLMGILRHKIMDYFRRLYSKKNHEEFGEEVLSSEDDHGAKMPGAGNPIQDPMATMESGELRKTLKRCVNALPEKLRFLYLEREMEGNPTGDLCEQLGITDNHFHVLMHRMRRQLRDCFKKHGIETLS